MDHQGLFDNDQSLGRSRRYDSCWDNILKSVCKLHFIIRCLNLIFSIVVTACVAHNAWVGIQCLYNSGSSVCNYVTTIGVLSCCAIIVFIIIDLLFNSIEGYLLRKFIILADIFFFGLWSFMWFTGFCYLADAWRRTSDSKEVTDAKSAMQAAIVFSFFNIGSFALVSLLALRRFRDGAAEDFTVDFAAVTRLIRSPEAPPTHSSSSTYSSLPEGLSHQSNPYNQSYASPSSGHASSQIPARNDFGSEATPLGREQGGRGGVEGGVRSDNYGSGQAKLIELGPEPETDSSQYQN